MSAAQYDTSTKLQKPRTSRHGRSLHLSYECPHRLNVSKVYPVHSPRGAEIVVSGYSDGLHILWRGGRPLHLESRTVIETKRDLSGSIQVRSEWNQPVSINKRSQRDDKPLITEHVAEADKPFYEAEEEEFDEDEPYPSFTQELKLSLGSAVLHIALPDIPAASVLQSRVQVPLILEQRLVIAAACADGSLRLITLHLTPPSASAKKNGRLGAQICELSPPSSSSAAARHVALTWTSKPTLTPASDTMDLDRPHPARDPLAETENLDLLVASSTSGHGETLDFYRIPIEFNTWTGGNIPDYAVPFHTLSLPAASHSLQFSTSHYPSRQHSQLLLADARGSLRVYDPLAAKDRPSSRASATADPSNIGACISAFSTAFQMPRSSSSTYPGLAQRRKIIQAAWVHGARAAIVLLDRGEWGVWDIDNVSQTKDRPSTTTSFVIKGFIGNADTPAAAEPKNKLTQSLVPSTPHTRQQRQEALFGVSKPTSTTFVPRGGISAIATAGIHGTIDDSIVLWYASEAYHIPSLASLWQRSLNSSGRDIGSLYGPGLSRIEGLDLSGELLNSVTQFPIREDATSATQRDFAITGEYRLVIVVATRPPTVKRSLFERKTGEISGLLDQQLLKRGELDLGGMDRLLDGMGGERNGFAKKRVGFVR